VPLIVVHGDRDDTVAPVNAACIVDQWGHAAGRDAMVSRGQVTGGRAYTRRRYAAAFGEPELELWIVHGAGHAWAGGSSAGSYTDPQGPDMSAELVRFFDMHPHQ
jgi:poly(3-hydroxybutyrate) depolymerase